MWELDYKKAECRRIGAFEPWCWGRLLQVPWTVRRSNQSILKEISPEYSLEGLMKLKLQYFGHLTWKADLMEKKPWCWETLKAWGEGDNRGWDDWMASPTRWIWVWASSRSWWWTGKSGVLQSMGSQSQTWLSNWTELKGSECIFVDLTLFHLLVSRILFFIFIFEGLLLHFFFFNFTILYWFCHISKWICHR